MPGGDPAADLDFKMEEGTLEGCLMAEASGPHCLYFKLWLPWMRKPDSEVSVSV